MKRATYLVAMVILALSVPFAFARGGRGGGGGHAAVHAGGHGYAGHGYGGAGYGRGGYGRGYGYGGGYYGGFWPGFGLGWGLGYGLGGYPYYGYGDYGYAYPYDYSDGNYPANPSYYGSVQPDAPAIPAAAPVQLDVIVPDAQAQVWIDGQLMQTAGTERDFVSSPVETGYRYSYQVRASWKQNGQPVTVERNVEVTPGAMTRVDFSQHLAGDSVGGE